MTPSDDSAQPAKLNRDGRVALYIQIADDLHAAIDAGELTGRLPTVEDLAATYAVARNTAAAAVRLLGREGVAVFSPGHGYYAAPPPHAVDQ
ncbi:MAG: GntR family transcriptional regulator [Actinobacteria bacterium]|nr:GntR family transcriptional regulator [Actinomycetota bacterium]